MRTFFLLALATASLFGQTPATPAPKAAPKAATTAAPKAATKAPVKAAPKPTPAPAAPKEPDTREPGLYGTMETTMGTMKFVLYEKIAPLSVRNFVELAQGRKQWFDEKVNTMVRKPLYPGVTFHRVIPGFMIQTGDPTGTGSGNVGFTVPDEFNPEYKFDRPGRLGMANIGQPNTNSSQFYITEVPTPWLDGRHSIFGQITENVELVNAIARVPRGAGDKPTTPVKIVKVTFERVGPVPPNAPEGAPTPKKSTVPAKKYTAPAKKAAPATKSAAPATKAAAPATKAATPQKK